MRGLFLSLSTARFLNQNCCIDIVTQLRPKNASHAQLRGTHDNPIGVRSKRSPACRSKFHVEMKQKKHSKLTSRSITPESKTPKGNPLPPVIHAKVRQPQGRVIIVGDVHGCLDELHDLLQSCSFRQGKDTLVLVGDLVNKGPKSEQVVRFAREHGVLSVRGNHDDAALAAYREHKDGKEVKEKFAWVPELTEADAEWLSGLPFTLRLGSRVHLVHAGLVPGVPLKDQRLEDLYEMRDVIPKKSGGWKAIAKHAPNGTAWAKVWEGPCHVFFGHDAQRRLQLWQSATGLDTGCCYGGELTACVLPEQSINWFSWLMSGLAILLPFCRRASAPTVEELGGQLVSVPSKQPKKE